MQPGEFQIDFPTGGVDRNFAFDAQPQLTTPTALNVFPLDPTTGRHRGGVRPVLLQLDTLASGAAPYHWCTVSYIDSGPKEGFLVGTAQGTYSTLDGTTYTERIATNPASNFTSVAYFQGFVYQATSGQNCIQAAIPSGSDAALSNANGGTAPTECGLVWVHQGRLALAGKSTAGHQVFMSATGDATDWDYADTTSGGAWANTGAEAGKIGHIIVAALNHNRDVSLIGSPRSIYAIVGNPKSSAGATRIVSSSLGPLMNNAWCKGIDATGGNPTYMMTYDGLYMIPAGDYSSPVPISRKKIPNELLNIDPTVGDRCCIGYDSRWPGIHISVDFNSGSDVNWFYYIPTDSWWPLELPITPHLYPTFPKAQTLARSAILPIGSAGSVRQYDYSAAQGGSNETFNSYVFIVVPLADPGSEGVLHSIAAALAKDSEDCVGEIYAGDSFEEAYDKALAGSSPDFTLDAWSWTSTHYWNETQHPRIRGNAAILKIVDALDRRWLLERIVARVTPAGFRRVG